MENRPVTVGIPLAEAVLCEHCQQITTKTRPQCAACGKPDLIEMAGLLDHTAPRGLLLEVERSVWLQRLAADNKIC